MVFFLTSPKKETCHIPRKNINKKIIDYNNHYFKTQMAAGLDEIYKQIVELRPLYKNSDIAGLYAYRNTLRGLMEKAFESESLRIDTKINKRKIKARELIAQKSKKILSLEQAYWKKRKDIDEKYSEGIIKLGFLSQQDIEEINVDNVLIIDPVHPQKHEPEEIENSDIEDGTGIDLSPSF